MIPAPTAATNVSTTSTCSATPSPVTGGSALKRLVRPRRVRRLLVERLPVPDAAPHELRPVRDHGDRVGLLRQQRPQLRVVPAEFVAGAVAVIPDARTQPFRLGHELLARHLV